MERGLMHRLDNTSVCTQSFLEEQLTICKTLNSPTEFRFWLITNVRFLLQEGMTHTLRNTSHTDYTVIQQHFRCHTSVYILVLSNVTPKDTPTECQLWSGFDKGTCRVILIIYKKTVRIHKYKRLHRRCH